MKEVLTFEQLTEAVIMLTKEVSELKRLLIEKQEQTATEQSNKLLTREETLRFLKVDSTTLWRWTNDGKVTAYGIGNRRYYKKAELIEALKPLK